MISEPALLIVITSAKEVMFSLCLLVSRSCKNKSADETVKSLMVIHISLCYGWARIRLGWG